MFRDLYRVKTSSSEGVRRNWRVSEKAARALCGVSEWHAWAENTQSNTGSSTASSRPAHLQNQPCSSTFHEFQQQYRRPIAVRAKAVWYCTIIEHTEHISSTGGNNYGWESGWKQAVLHFTRKTRRKAIFLFCQSQTSHTDAMSYSSPPRDLAACWFTYGKNPKCGQYGPDLKSKMMLGRWKIYLLWW